MPNRVALVAGGARGLGRAVVRALAGDGWTVAFCYRNSSQLAAELTEELAGAPGTVCAARCDVSCADQAAAWVAEAEERWSRIDALIHCVGPFHRVSLEDETPAQWCATFADNLHSVLYLSHAVAAGMRQREWGRIVTFGVANAERAAAQTHVTAYSLSKLAVIGLTRALAKSLAPHGITVNTISPGFINSGSDVTSGALTGAADGIVEVDALRRQIPAGHVGAADDIVALVRFLLSDRAGYVSGANIPVSGAWGL